MKTSQPQKVMGKNHRPKLLALVFPLAALFWGCDRIDQIQNEFRDLTPHEAYLESLVSAGLNETALALDWLKAAESSIQEAPPVTTPYQEEGFFPAELPQARGYKLSLRRGQQLSVLVTSDEGSPSAFRSINPRIAGVRISSDSGLCHTNTTRTSPKREI